MPIIHNFDYNHNKTLNICSTYETYPEMVNDGDISPNRFIVCNKIILENVNGFSYESLNDAIKNHDNKTIDLKNSLKSDSFICENVLNNVEIKASKFIANSYFYIFTQQGDEKLISHVENHLNYFLFEKYKIRV